ncbi:MAG: hypothetical protein JWR16_3601 [Nevskia sp.]|nr:hypothetical protein [Nevskia sp.]
MMRPLEDTLINFYKWDLLVRLRQLSDKHHPHIRLLPQPARWPQRSALVLSLCALALSSALALAADEVSPAADLVAASSDVETAAIRAIAAGRSLIDDRITPAPARVSVYIGQNQASVLMQSLEVTIDQAEPLRIGFSQPIATALADSYGLIRVGRFTLPQGIHNAHAHLSYVDRYAETPKTLELDWDGAIDRQPGELSIEISLKRNLSASSAKIDVAQWQLIAQKESWLDRAVRGIQRRNSVISLFHPGERQDPIGRYAKYLSALGKPEAALFELQGLARSNDPNLLPVAYWQQLADAYRKANLLDDASAICDRLKALGGDKQDIAMERLHLAQAEYSRGNLRRAQSLLLLARADVPPIQALNWRFAYAQVLFAQNKVAEATDLLKTQDSDYISALRYMNEPVESIRETGYNRYNFAVELLKRGEEQRGLSWLDLVGRLTSNDEQMLALRDKANLTLGWHFLKDKQGKTALGILGRVRETGPFSDAALLGIGWSELVPAGDTHWRSRLSLESKSSPEYVMDLNPVMRHSLTQLKVLEPELHGEVGPRRFSKDTPPSNRTEGLQRALQLWSLLLDQHSDSPASEEAALAVGYAYDQLHDQARARDAYLQAVQKMELAQARLSEAANAIQAGALTEQLAKAHNAFDLFQVLGHFGFAADTLDHGFYAALNRYRANARMIEAIDSIETQLPNLPAAVAESTPSDTSSDPAIAALLAYTPAPIDSAALLAQLDELKQALIDEQQTAAKKLDATALSLIDRQQQVLKTYLKAAYFSAARLQDNRPASDRLGP